MLTRLVGLAAAIWLGAQLGFGYVVAPVLFRWLPKIEAGNIAGVLFQVVAFIGLVIWLLVGVLVWRQKRPIGYAVAGLWGLLAVNVWLVTPVIKAYKTDTHHWLLAWLGGSFAVWHGIYSLIYLLCSLLGLGLFWRLNRFDLK